MTTRSTVVPNPDRSKRNDGGSTVSSTAPAPTTAEKGSGQSTIETVTGEPSVIRRMARPQTRTPSRSGSGTRWAGFADPNVPPTTTAGVTRGSVMPIGSRYRSTVLGVDDASILVPVPAGARVRTTRNGKPVVSTGDSTAQVCTFGNASGASPMAWETP